MFVPVPNQEGMTLVSKDSSTLTVIDPVNNPKDDFGLYYNPKYSQKYNMLAFSAPHLLYIMSMANRNAKLVVNNVDHPNLADFRFFNNQEKIIYTNEDENTFYIVDFNGAMMKTILIKIK
ncbi:hypothetical protein [Mucilaginibacter gotjawali]|nr:hypothetical protein [Mucilaginibacter gotjawali]